MAVDGRSLMFEELSAFVAKAYANLLDPHQPIRLQYLDDEEDLVSMSTPLEMKEAGIVT